MSLCDLLIFIFIFSLVHCSITFDSYCDKTRHRSYNTYTLHYINDEWILTNRVLKTTLMEESHTAVNISNDYNRVIKEYEMEAKKVVVVTDSAANMVAACRLTGNHRVPCIVHKCNTLIQVDMLQNPRVKPIPELLAKMRAGQKKLLYRFEELKEIRETDIQNQLALLMSELCELDDIVNTENEYVSGEDDEIFKSICNLNRNQNTFNGLKTLSNIRFGCLFKIAQSYKENSSM